MTKLQQIKRSAPDIVRDGLRQAINDGQFVAGDQLRQDEIAGRFGTSRIPVREALRQLESEGLVTLQANRGAVVAGVSLEDVLELLDIRIGLECRALKLAIPNMAAEDFEALDEMLEHYGAESLPRRWSEMNETFHFTLYAPCRRPKLMALIRSTWEQIGRFTRTQVSLTTGRDRPLREHRDLLAACRKGRVPAATRLLEEHVGETQKSLVAAAQRGGRFNLRRGLD